MTGKVEFTTDGRICTATLENPGKRNAISSEIVSQLTEKLEKLSEVDEMRVLVITGSGEKAFSAGYDITEFSDDDGTVKRDEERRRGRQAFYDLTDKLQEFKHPTIAMINGDAIGGAFEMVSSCDLRVASSDARFGIPPARLGSIYGDSGIRKFVDLIGPMNTKELLFTADLVGAERASEMGLLTDVVPRADLEPRTYDLAKSIAKNAPLSVRGMKRIINGVTEKRTFTEREKAWVDRLRREAYDSRDYEEGVTAFSEDREPEFTGR